MTNAQRLAYEYNDILGVMEMLLECTPIDNVGDREQIDTKKAKILKYMEHSRNVGILEEN